MKKIILFAFLFISVNSISQEFGKFTIDNYTIYNNKTIFKNDVWYTTEDKRFCFKLFNQTPIGIKKLIDEVEYILLKNSADFESTFIDKSYLSSSVKDIKDYEMLNFTINQESSIIEKQWMLSSSTYLTVTISKEHYKIILLKL